MPSTKVARVPVFVGVDVGSSSVNVVGVAAGGDFAGTPVYVTIADHPGPTEALKHAFRLFLDSLPASPGCDVTGVGTTGSGRELNRHIVGGDLSRTEIFAHAVGIKTLVERGEVPGVSSEMASDQASRVGTVIEIGGQDAKVIIFDDSGVPSFFNMNSICSAGTGEFLVQIADEAGVAIDEFGPLALLSRNPARIDATCTVFSKRDFRHLTQKGVPLPDRLAGICAAMAHNYLTNVVGTVRVRPPVVFQGGVAANGGMRAALERRLELPVAVPRHFGVVGALGMAVIVRDHALRLDTFATRFKDDFFERRYKSRIRYCHGCQNACEVTEPLEEAPQGAAEPVVLDRLGGRCERSHNPKNLKEQPQALANIMLPIERPPRQRRDVGRGADAGVRAAARASILPHRVRRRADGLLFAGIDGGSRGTKFALLRAAASDPDVEVLEVGSVDTGGDAIQALRRALAGLAAAVNANGGEGRLAAVGTTGSAGELFRDIISKDPESADYRSTELLSHYAWASHWRPDVGTVIDVGGNDSKIIIVRDAGLDFRMNDKCAAGTGSFLEAAAKRFEVPLERFSGVALNSRNPARIAGRCAVFGESDLIHKSRIGFPVEDLFLGLCYAIGKTYFSDVARGKKLRVPIVAQGGTFLIEAVAVAFRELTGLGEHEFLVHSDRRYVLGAGALGAAFLAKNRWEQGYDSAFKGFAHLLGDAIGTVYSSVSLACRYRPCRKRCEGVVALLEDGVPISGYKAIDCEYGLFDGFVGKDPARRGLMAELVAGASGDAWQPPDMRQPGGLSRGGEVDERRQRAASGS